jgi:hypothetical protein
VWITTPTDGASFLAGTPIAFNGSALDAEDRILADGAFLWTSDRDGELGRGPSISGTLSPGIHTIRLLAFDSDRNIGSARISITITVAVPNNPPTATITAPADGSSFAAGASVAFSGTGSDPEDGALTGASLVWSTDLDGQIGTGVGFSTTALSIGVHTITLTATDSNGATGTDQITVTVTNNPPTATITNPPSGSIVLVGVSILFTGTGSDPEDGPLTGASLSWSSDLDGPLGTGVSISVGFLSVGTHTITLTATDSMGATGTDQVTVIIIIVE